MNTSVAIDAARGAAGGDARMIGKVPEAMVAILPRVDAAARQLARVGAAERKRSLACDEDRAADSIERRRLPRERVSGGADARYEAQLFGQTRAPAPRFTHQAAVAHYTSLTLLGEVVGPAAAAVPLHEPPRRLLDIEV